MQEGLSKPEEIIQKGTEILSFIRKQAIQKHFTNILYCHIETFHILLIQNQWIKVQSLHMTLAQIFDRILIVMNNLKAFLGQLIKEKFFSEIGQNKNYLPLIMKMVSEFDLIPKYFQDTTLSKRFIEEEFNFKNLTQQLAFIDEISQKLIDKYKDYKTMIRSSSTFPPGELSIIFDLSYMPNDECTISWFLFSMKLTSFIYDLDKTELKSNHLAQIRRLVDSLKVSAISFDTLNLFFNYLWLKTSERKSILSIQENKTFIENNASVIIDEYPILHLTFDDKHIKIHPRGYDNPSNVNFRGDGITYFGRKTQVNAALNDVYLNENDLTVSRKQFQIVYREDGKKYVLLCISNSNPTMIKITYKFPLHQGTLFQLSDNQIFKVENIGYLFKKHPDQYLNTPNEIEKKFKNDLAGNSPAAMKKIFENKFDVLAESLFLSVLELDPPDVEKSLNTTKTVPLKFDATATSMITKNDIKNFQKPGLQQTTLAKKDQPPFIEIACLQGDELFSKKLVVKNPKESQIFVMGRKSENDVVMNSQHLSSIHCQLMFDAEKDTWYIGEKLIKAQEKYSFNGTYVYCKDFVEYTTKRPSQAINLEEGMIVRVGGNEIHVHIEEEKY